MEQVFKPFAWRLSQGQVALGCSSVSLWIDFRFLYVVTMLFLYIVTISDWFSLIILNAVSTAKT